MWLKVISQNTYFLRLLLMLCLGALPSSALALAVPRQEVARQLEEIYSSIQAISGRIETDKREIDRLILEKKVKTIVLLLGGVNSGKTTLLNFLADRRLIVIQGRLALKTIKVENPINVEQEGPLQGTRIPTYHLDEATGFVFYDCAGLDDLAPAGQLINAFVCEKLFSLYSNFPRKILFLLDVKSVSQRHTNFIASIKNLATMFRGNINALKDSLSAVGTKHDVSLEDIICNAARQGDDLKCDLAAIIGEAGYIRDELALSDEAKQLLQGFAESTYPVAYFPNPIALGEYLSVQARANCRQLIKAAAEASKSTLPFAVIPRPIPSDGGLLLAGELLDELSRVVTFYIKEEVTEKFIKLFRTTLTRGKKAKDVRQIFVAVKNALKDQLKSEYDSFEAGCTAIQGAVSLTVDQDAVRFIQDQLAYMRFLRLCCEDTVLPFATWYTAFEDIQTMSEALATDPVFTMSDDDKVLKVSAVYLGSDDITNECGRIGLPKIVVVYVGDTFYCDADMTLPGVSCVIIAPKWIVTGTYKISLNGGDGRNAARRKRHDGIAGSPGSHGGHMFGACIRGNNLNELTINTSGGKGGNGTNGTAGNDGESGKDGTFSERVTDSHETTEELGNLNVMDRRAKYPTLTTAIEKVPSLLGKDIRALCYKLSICKGKGTVGANGADGGKGGEGGPGGKGGQINFSGPQQDNIRKIHGRGREGKDGEPGKGGEGGEGGNDRRNEYFTGLKIYYKPCTVALRRENLALVSDVILKSTHVGPRAANGNNGSTPQELVEAESNEDSIPEAIQQDVHLQAHNVWVRQMKETKIAPFVLGMQDEIVD